MRVRFAEVQGGRQTAMLERQRCFNQRGHARRNVHVTHVCFQRSESAVIDFPAAPPARNACVSAATSIGSPKGGVPVP